MGLTCLFLSLWGASIRFTTPMLFALAFLPMFGLGGLTGLPLGRIDAGLDLELAALDQVGRAAIDICGDGRQRDKRKPGGEDE